jgi:hypothetical protein
MNENSNYKSLKELIGQTENESSQFIPDLLKKVQAPTSIVKKVIFEIMQVKLVEDHQYFLSQNKAYEKLLNKSSKKIENLILKLMIFGNKINSNNEMPNIRKK